MDFVVGECFDYLGGWEFCECGVGDVMEVEVGIVVMGDVNC